MVSIGFTTSSGWLSSIIRGVTKSKASHAFILLEPDEPFYGHKQWVLEAVGTGFHLIPYDTYLSPSTNLVDLIPIAYELDIQKAMDWLGGKYDIGGLVGESYVTLARWIKTKWKNLKFKVRNPLHEKNTMYCSEAIAYLLQDSHYPHSEALVPYNISPEDLYEFITSGILPPDSLVH